LCTEARSWTAIVYVPGVSCCTGVPFTSVNEIVKPGPTVAVSVSPAASAGPDRSDAPQTRAPATAAANAPAALIQLRLLAVIGDPPAAHTRATIDRIRGSASGLPATTVGAPCILQPP